jgi:hypothetical protein
MLQIDAPYMRLLQLERARRGDPPASSAMLYVSPEAEVSISSSLLLYQQLGSIRTRVASWRSGYQWHLTFRS